MTILDLFAAASQVKIKPSDVNIPKVEAIAVLGGVLDGIYMIVGAVAVVIIILSGFSFASAAYDPAKIAKAKNAILYSVVGLVVVSIAFAITQFIVGKMTGKF
jgi:heme O synthase-like polyprenyltransferase